MSLSTRSASLNSGRLVLAVCPNMIWLAKMLCAYHKLPPLNRRFSAFEAIIATAVPRTTAAIPITAFSAKLINWNKNNRATTSHSAFRSLAAMAST
jgi:hypothetical protein